MSLRLDYFKTLVQAGNCTLGEAQIYLWRKYTLIRLLYFRKLSTTDS